MIFGEGYDESLWLILKSEKENRKKIVDFIKSIPEEMYVEIYRSIDMVNKYLNGTCLYEERDEKNLHSSFKMVDDVLYWYCIEPYSGKLNLGYSVFNGNNYTSSFEMALYLLDKVNWNIYKQDFLGTIEIDKKINRYGVSNGMKKDYILERTKGKHYVLCSSNDNVKYSRVKMNKILEGNFLFNLREFDTKENFVLKRKIGSFY